MVPVELPCGVLCLFVNKDKGRLRAARPPTAAEQLTRKAQSSPSVHLLLVSLLGFCSPNPHFPTLLFTQGHNKRYHYTFLRNSICFNLCCILMLETFSVCLFSWEEFQSWEVEHLKLQTQTSFASERKGQCFLQLNTSDNVLGAEIQLAQILCSNEVTIL